MRGLSIFADTATFSSHYRGTSKFERALLFLLALSVFTKEIFTIFLFGIEFDSLSYTFFLLTFLYIIVGNKLIDKVVLRIIFILFGLSFYSIITLNLAVSPFLKQFIPISIILITTSFVIRKFQVSDVFHQYIIISKFAGVLGIIQITLKFVAGINFFTDYGQLWIDSVAREPSHYAVIILPATFYTFIKKRDYRFTFLILIVNLLLTMKITGYVVFFVLFVIYYRRWYQLILLVPLGILISRALYEVEDYSSRIDGFRFYFNNPEVYGQNSTIFSFMSNLQVGIQNLKNNLWSGVGLGGHEMSYHKYFLEHSLPNSLYRLYGLNLKSAHSLFIRIFRTGYYRRHRISINGYK